MGTRTLLQALIGIGLATAVAIAGADSSDGSFTEAQAEQGKRLYMQHCAGCHGAKLEGAVTAPALSGESFAKRSAEAGNTADDLFFVVRTFMPYNEPGKLSKQEYVDVVAYLLKANGHSAGAKKLTADGKMLSAIRLAAKED